MPVCDSLEIGHTYKTSRTQATEATRTTVGYIDFDKSIQHFEFVKRALRMGQLLHATTMTPDDSEDYLSSTGQKMIGQKPGLKPRSWGASTPMKMCIQAVLDSTGALRHMNKNNSERPVCTTHSLTPVSTSFLFVFDTEWVMSTCEHQGRDIVL